MGAYSSFAMLALTHHFIVQIAAKQVGIKGWFTNYALLGDDIVIADEVVAERYYIIMSQVLGVDINLSKTIVSNVGGLEFAKRLRLGDLDYSPIGPKALLQSIRDINLLPSLIKDALDKGVEVTSDSLLTLRKDFVFSQRISKFTIQKVLFGLLAPFGPVSSNRPIPLFMEKGSALFDNAKRKFYKGTGAFHHTVSEMIKSMMIEHVERIGQRNYEVVKL